MKKLLLNAAVAVSAIAMTVPANAAVFNLTGSSSGGTLGGGNFLQFTADDGTQAIVTAWNFNGTSLARSSVQKFGTGLGAISTGDSNGANNLHTVDNNLSIDFLVFQFSTDILAQSVKVNPYDIPQGRDRKGNTIWGRDTDTSVGFGDTNAAWNSYINFALGSNQALFTSDVEKTGGNSSITHSVVGNATAGNLLFVAAGIDNMDHIYDGWKLETLKFSKAPAVPEPASWAMMIAGFGLVGGAMRRRSTMTPAIA